MESNQHNQDTPKVSEATPLPWVVSTPADDELFWDEDYPRDVTIRSTIKDGRGYQIAKMSGVHERTLSDAHLIVRAVNQSPAFDAMRNALKGTARYTRSDGPCWCPHGADDQSGHLEFCGDARAAIALADKLGEGK